MRIPNSKKDMVATLLARVVDSILTVLTKDSDPESTPQVLTSAIVMLVASVLLVVSLVLALICRGGIDEIQISVVR